jgi:hypothetical protein
VPSLGGESLSPLTGALRLAKIDPHRNLLNAISWPGE